MVNMHEVARKAGVSVATVSRVINNYKSVSETTKEKVEKAINELKYEPNFLGRNLRKAKSGLILVLIPTISNPFYAEIVKGIEDTAIQFQYNILLCATNGDPKREEAYFDLLRNRLADGVITMDPAVNQERLHELIEDYPIVQCSEYVETGKVPFISIDNFTAAYRAVKYLIQLGHKHIALINNDLRYLYSRQREMGYIRALDEYGIEHDPDQVVYTYGLDFDYGQLAMQRLLQGKKKITAVFAVSDILAIGALKEINNQGLKVPKDIAIIGFDHISFSNMTYPTLTTVSQPMYKMGEIAAKMIFKAIDGEKVESIMLDHHLIIRDSTQG